LSDELVLATISRLIFHYINFVFDNFTATHLSNVLLCWTLAAGA